MMAFSVSERHGGSLVVLGTFGAEGHWFESH